MLPFRIDDKDNFIFEQILMSEPDILFIRQLTVLYLEMAKNWIHYIVKFLFLAFSRN